AISAARDDLRDGGLANSRWPVQHDRGSRVEFGIRQVAKWTACPQDRRLTGKLVERGWSHAHR
ncbi:MAG: hypothetical protein RL672_618, partial [Actinomycetota bacterium]